MHAISGEQYSQVCLSQRLFRGSWRTEWEKPFGTEDNDQYPNDRPRHFKCPRRSSTSWWYSKACLAGSPFSQIEQDDSPSVQVVITPGQAASWSALRSLLMQCPTVCASIEYISRNHCHLLQTHQRQDEVRFMTDRWHVEGEEGSHMRGDESEMKIC